MFPDILIILDVKTFSNDPKVKYHGIYNTDGFGVVIRNLSEADFLHPHSFLPDIYYKIFL
jgi:hypothetical protein